MTALGIELHRILDSESTFPPMTPDSLARVLYATGYSPKPSEPDIIAALETLMLDGKVERVHSARLGARWRVPKTMPGPDMSQPEPPGAA